MGSYSTTQNSDGQRTVVSDAFHQADNRNLGGLAFLFIAYCLRTLKDNV
jgi:hypothetical protein